MARKNGFFSCENEEKAGEKNSKSYITLFIIVIIGLLTFQKWYSNYLIAEGYIGYVHSQFDTFGLLEYLKDQDITVVDLTEKKDSFVDVYHFKLKGELTEERSVMRG